MIRQTVKGKRQKVKSLIGLFLLPFSFSLLASAGCQNCDRVESELRRTERELRETREDLYRSTALNEALQHELCGWRQGQPAQAAPQPGVRESVQPRAGEPTLKPAAPESPPSTPAPEQAFLSGTVKDIVLGRQTGGYDEDKIPGDEALQVIVEPRDIDGHALKIPGCLHITALEIMPEGVKRPLSTWDFTAAELRRTWKEGFFGTGYVVIVPWKCWPLTEKLRIVAQFTLSDGRLFEADKDVTVKLPPAEYRKPLPGVMPAPEEGPLLSMPHRVGKPMTPAPSAASAERVAPLENAVRLMSPQ